MVDVQNRITTIFDVQGQRLVEDGIKSISRSFTETSNTMKRVVTQTKTAADGFKGLSTTVKEVQGNFVGFRGEFLTFLFAGIAIERTFSRIARSATTTFQKIIATSSGAISNISILSSNFDFLKFTVGAAINTALAPLIPFLIQMIRFAAEFIEQNPAKVFAAIAAAIIGGKLLSILSQVALLFFGIQQLAVSLGATGILGFLTKLFAIVTSPAALLFIGFFAALFAIWSADIGDIRASVSDFISTLAQDFLDVFNDIFGIFRGAWKIILGIMTGNYELFKAGLAEFGTSVVLLVVDLAAGIIKAIVNAVSIAIKVTQELMGNLKVIVNQGVADIFGITLSDDFLQGVREEEDRWIETIENGRFKIIQSVDNVKTKFRELLPEQEKVSTKGLELAKSTDTVAASTDKMNKSLDTTAGSAKTATDQLQQLLNVLSG